MQLPVRNAVTVPEATGPTGRPFVPGVPTDAEIAELLAPVIARIRALEKSGEPLLVAFCRRRDATSDPNDFLQVTEMEPAYKIEPYVRPRASMYRGL